MIKAGNESYWYAAFLTQFWLGCRAEELTILKVGNFKGSYIQIRPLIIDGIEVKGLKTEKSLSNVPVDEELTTIIKERIKAVGNKADRLLFPAPDDHMERRKDKALNLYRHDTFCKHYTAIIKKYGVQSGLATEVCTARLCRYSRGMDLFNREGYALDYVAQFLRDREETIEAHYATRLIIDPKTQKKVWLKE